MAKRELLATPLQRVLAMRGSQWYVAHMDDYFERSEKPRYDKGWFHPSSLSHPCDAFLAFSFLGLEEHGDLPRAQTRRIWDNGHSSEARWQTAIKRAGLATLGKRPGDRNIEIPQYRIRGELDNVIRNPQTGELMIWEMKTMRQERFNDLVAPLSEHVIQVHPYMFAKGILQTLIQYECKNTQRYKEFLVTFDGEVWKGIVDRVTRIMERLGNRQEVVRSPVPDDSRCPFYDRCSVHDFRKGVEQHAQ